MNISSTSDNAQSVVRQAMEKLPSTDSVPAISPELKIQLCRECIDGVFEVAQEWADAAVKAKGLPAGSAVQAEDLLSGPTVVLRQLQLTIQTLQAVQREESPIRSKHISRLPDGRLAVRVFPTHGLFDSLTFMGLEGTVRMQPEAESDNLHGDRLAQIREGRLQGTTAVLGAGNVSSIPATDSLNRILFEGRRVLLKMNPVNDYLAPIFERAFAPLISNDLLVIMTGDAEVGKQLIHHERVDDVHITGSAATHDAIVWGTDPQAIQARKQDDQRLLDKPVTSELGNVTPWVIVPGHYSKRELQSQAQHVAASITNNASFNCLATKVLVTWDRWKQRTEFLNLLQHALHDIPARPAYYPGAIQRFERFANRPAEPNQHNRLPWTLLTDQRLDERPELFREESFVCVCAETRLPASDPVDFVRQATEFVNEQMTGTLCASITLPRYFQKQHPDAVEHALSELRYGTVCVNQWSGLAYGLVSPPWGAYPGATLQDVGSGIGNVHNTYQLDRIEKTVLAGPLINFPRPVWFASHPNAVAVARGLLKLYHRPSPIRLPKLFAAALR